MRLISLTRSALLLTMCLAAAACGGAGGAGGAPDGGGGLVLHYYTHIGSVASRDGHVRSDGFVQTHWGFAEIGDNDVNQSMRVFLSFPLNEIPADAIVTNAQLIVRTPATSGDFFGIVPRILEHMDIGNSLDAIDYNLAPRTPGAIPIGPALSFSESWYDVTDKVLLDRAEGRFYIDFRQRFAIETDNDGSWDSGRVLTGAPGNPQDRTHLLVEYTLP